MKKTFLIFALFASIMNAYADNTLEAAPVTIPQGGAGTINIELNNDKAYTAFTLKLTLPEGINYDSFTKGDRFSESHSVSATPSGQVVTFGCLSTANESITGTSGTLLSVNVTANANLAIGTTLSATLNEVIFSTTSGEETLSNVNIDITIGEPSDGRVLLDEESITPPENASGVNVRVQRTIVANIWNTICLPFAMTAEQVTAAFGDDVELCDFNDYEVSDDGESINVKFVDVTSIEANHPYIIKVSNAVTEFTVDNVDINPQEAVADFSPNPRRPHQFIGTYVAGTVLEWGMLFLSDNQYWYSIGSTTINAFRAYFNFYDLIPDFEDNYDSRRITMSFEETTGIND